LRRALKNRPATVASVTSEGKKYVITTSLRRRLLAGLAASVIISPVMVGETWAAPQGQVETVEFNIPAGSLDAALVAFANQSGRQLVYSQQLVEGLRSAGLKGRFTPDEAIARLLAGAPIELRRGGANGFVLKRRAAPGDAQGSTPGFFPQAAVAADEVIQLEELVVTGTLIRGAGNGSSPIVTVNRDELDRTGRATVAEMLTDLPQAFGGKASPDTNLANTDGSGTNPAVATGINLRGLGASAILVMVDGRRMAGAGLNGAFADVSTLPTAALPPCRPNAAVRSPRAAAPPCPPKSAASPRTATWPPPPVEPAAR
jgi:iron complex outermembrane recepter protein